MRLYDLVTHPSEPRLLRFVYDEASRSTSITLHEVDDGAVVEVGSSRVESLLRYPAVCGGGVVAFDMPDWGAVLQIHTLDWSLGATSHRTIERELLALFRAALEPSHDLLIIDRQFGQPGEGGKALLLDAATLEEIGSIPLNANLVAIALEGRGSRIALMHTDQDSAEVQLYERTDSGVHRIRDIARPQLISDGIGGSVQFLPNDELLVIAVETWSGKTTAGVYRLTDGAARFVVALPTQIRWEAFAPDHPSLDAETKVEMFAAQAINRTTAACVARDVWIGGYREALQLCLDSGRVQATVTLPVGGFVTHVMRAGNRVITMDNFGELALVC